MCVGWRDRDEQRSNIDSALDADRNELSTLLLLLLLLAIFGDLSEALWQLQSAAVTVITREMMGMVMMVLSQFCIRAVNHVHVRRVQVGAGDGWRSTFSRFPSFYLRAMRLLERVVALVQWCSSVCICLSVCLGRACNVIIRCTYAHLSLWLDSPMFWATWHHRCQPTSNRLFPVLPGREVHGVQVQTRRRTMINNLKWVVRRWIWWN